jgi:glyoxylate/hydroxypyruvate reductase A
MRPRASSSEQSRAWPTDERADVRAADSREELQRVAVTSAVGIHATPLAEFSLLGLLAFTKNLPRLSDDKRAHRWRHYPVDELRGATLLVVGLGKVGAEVARVASALGMQVLAVNRSGKSDSPHLSELRTADALMELLPRADAVVISLPLTEETRGMFGARAIARMKDGAILVNVGRGQVIDEQALVAALQSRKLAGAALDVFATEPLPDDSPLWELPNVLISPHTAALSWRENERIVALFADNLERHLRGEPLQNRVDSKHFY